MKITKDGIRFGLQNFLVILEEEQNKERRVIEDIFSLEEYKLIEKIEPKAYVNSK